MDHLLEKLFSFFKTYKQEAELWCRHRTWFIYAMWQPYFLYIGIKHISDSRYQSWFGALNLGFHELGHYVFAPFGEFLTYAGGSIFQCLIPILSIGMFLKQKHYFGPGVMGVWLSTNLFSVATYMADSRARQLDLVAPGIGVIPAEEAGTNHDWWQIFTRLGILPWDTTIAFLVRLISFNLLLLSVAYLCWLCYRMAFPISPLKEGTMLKNRSGIP